MSKVIREGWAEAAKLMHEQGDDELIIDDLFDIDKTWGEKI